MTADTRPRVRVGIVSWNTADVLDACLAALPAAVDGCDAQVVVVDNASADQSAAVARRHAPLVSVVENPTNVGYAKAMNQALRGSDAAVLIALNPDTVPPPGSLARLVDALLTDDSAGLVAPALVDPDGTPQHSVHRFPSPRLSAVVCFVPRRVLRRGLGERWCLEGFPGPRGGETGRDADGDTGREVDWAIGAVHVLRASAVGADAPYSERWFMYVEDLDLCWRLRGDGWKRLVVDDVAIPHVGNVAGAKAWGAGRTRRWLSATYDWYRLSQGGFATRRWAAVNTLGVTVRLTGSTLRGLTGPRRGAGRSRARELLDVLPLHAEALVRGGMRPLAGPPSDQAAGPASVRGGDPAGGVPASGDPASGVSTDGVSTDGASTAGASTGAVVAGPVTTREPVADAG